MAKEGIMDNKISYRLQNAENGEQRENMPKER